MDSNDDDDEAGCRYCRGTESSVLNPLLAPCACRGSMMYAHAECLYAMEVLHCSICRSLFTGRVHAYEILYAFPPVVLVICVLDAGVHAVAFQRIDVALWYAAMLVVVNVHRAAEFHYVLDATPMARPVWGLVRFAAESLFAVLLIYKFLMILILPLEGYAEYS
jgi:E3 ubiquitin-protein ligase DOA10